MCQVDLASGRLNLSDPDFSVPGAIALDLKRRYRSTNLWRGDLGYGWGHTLGVSLWQESEGFIFRGADGRRIPFAVPQPGNPAVQPSESAALDIVAAQDLPWKILAADLTSGALTVQIADDYTLIFDARSYGDRYLWRGIAERTGKLMVVYPGREGLPETLVDPAGFTVHLSRSRSGLLTEVRLASPDVHQPPVSLLRFEFDGNEDLVAVHDAAGTRTYEYDKHRLIRHADRNGGACISVFDPLGRCIQTSGPNGVHQRTYSYDAEHRTTTVLDSQGNQSTYVYAPNEAIVETIDPLGGASRYDYDAVGRLVIATDQLGYETKLCYSEDGSQRAKIGPDGSIMQVETNRLGDVVGIRTAAGVSYEFKRDALGRLVEKTTPTSGTYQISYGDGDKTTEVTIPTGKKVVVTRTTDMRSVSESDEEGTRIEETFDLLGRLIRFQDAAGFVTHYAYDDAGKLSEILHPDGSKRRLQYDAEGHLVWVQDETGAVTKWAYDNAGRCIANIQPDGGTLSFQYDSEDRLTGIQDLDGLWHKYGYDQRGWLVWQQFTDGRFEKYEHDARGFLSKMINSDESEIQVERDEVGRIVNILYPDGSQKSVKYDPGGNWLRVERNGHVLERVPDPKRKKETETQDDFVVTRIFGDAAELLSVVDSSGRTVTYEYDADGRPIAASGPRRHSFSYDRVGNLVSWETPSGIVERRSFDTRRRLIDQTITRGPTVILQRHYSYDKMGRLVRLTDSSASTREYEYDPCGRLIRADGDVFPYNSSGDLIGRGLRYETGHRIDSTPSYTLRYNALGFPVERISAQGTDELSYFVYGQLTRVKLASGDDVRYEYDPHDRLVERRVNDKAEQYRWNGEQLWLIRAHDGINTEFVYLPGQVSPLEQTTGSQSYSVHCDHAGKIHTLIDENGSIVWRAPTEPWGNAAKARNGNSGSLAPILFPGQIRDPLTSICYNRYRAYFPESAHYLTPDPIGVWGGMDAYRYPQDPVNFIDPEGLKCRGKNNDPTLYRGDKRPPHEICANGFSAKNPAGNLSVYEHVEGKGGSNWISTTHEPSVAEGPAFGKGGNVYVIDNPGCGVEVDCDPAVMAKYGADPPDSEHEIAFNRSIPASNIRGYYPVSAAGVPGAFQAC